MIRARLPLVAPLAFLLALADAAHAQTQTGRNDACSAGITCDCESIKGAGILTGEWRKDCRACQSRIVDHCRKVYAEGRDALSAIEEAVEKVGYCTKVCSVIGPNPAPLPPDKRPLQTEAEARMPPPVRKMKLLCRAGERLAYDEAAQGAGCTNRVGKRNGLWIFRDAARGVIVEVHYRDGREIGRRERKA